MEKMDMKTMVKVFEANGIKVKQKKYSKMIEIKQQCGKMTIEDKITVYAMNMNDLITYVITRDSSKQVLSKGTGNGNEWIKDNRYIDENIFWNQMHPDTESEDEE